MMRRGTRRQALRIGVGLAGTFAAGPVFARTEVEQIVAAFTGGRTPEAAGIRLDVPAMADNANAVPVGVKLTERMTAEAYCTEMILLAEKNPRPLASRFRFTPAIGVADVATRIRLSETQHVTVLAKMSDGRILGERRELTITGGGCGW